MSESEIAEGHFGDPRILPLAVRRRIFAYIGGLTVLLAFCDPSGGLLDVPVSFFPEEQAASRCE